MKRYDVVCTTVGHICSGYDGAWGAFLIAHVKYVHQGRSQSSKKRDRQVHKAMVGGRRWVCRFQTQTNSTCWLTEHGQMGITLKVLGPITNPPPNRMQGRRSCVSAWINGWLTRDCKRGGYAENVAAPGAFISPVVMQTSSRRRRPPLDGKDPFAHLTYKVAIVCTRGLVLIQTVNPTPALRPDQRQSHTVLGSPQQTMATHLAIVRIPTVRATSSVSRVLCHLPPISFVISPLLASSAMTSSRYGGVFIR